MTAKRQTETGKRKEPGEPLQSTSPNPPRKSPQSAKSQNPGSPKRSNEPPRAEKTAPSASAQQSATQQKPETPKQAKAPARTEKTAPSASAKQSATPQKPETPKQAKEPPRAEKTAPSASAQQAVTPQQSEAPKQAKAPARSKKLPQSKPKAPSKEQPASSAQHQPGKSPRGEKPQVLAKPRQFVILFEARSGSSHLVSVLNSSDRILCYAEIFAGQDLPTSQLILDRFLANEAVEEINPYARDPLFGITGDRNKVSWVGFKTKIHDLHDVPGTLRKLEKAGVALILLTRQNVVKQSLSRITGNLLYARTGSFNASSPDQKVERVTVDPFELVSFAHLYDANRKLLWYLYKGWAGKKTHIRYEDLLSDPARIIAEIAKFLEIPSFTPSSAFVKNTSKNTSDAIENYEEVKKALIDADLADYA